MALNVTSYGADITFEARENLVEMKGVESMFSAQALYADEVQTSAANQSTVKDVMQIQSEET
uniref:Uncharacterized protein n=1 Tax=Hyaloperonospora arabidopsidis (strain Emoy2) TaxID=559515 RepID=M4BJ37_HYAAE